MTGRTETGVATPFSLRSALAEPTTGTSRTATPTSTLETDTHLVPEQMARHHLEDRQREAELRRRRHAARAVRRAEAAERRARLARDAAVLAVREHGVLVVN